MKRLNIKIALFITFLGAINSAYSQDSLLPGKTDTKPTIDGILGEPIWQDAPMVSGFKTFVPDYEKDMGHKTEVYMAYDEGNLYFAFKAFDDPSKIKTSIAARDKIREMIGFV